MEITKLDSYITNYYYMGTYAYIYSLHRLCYIPIGSMQKGDNQLSCKLITINIKPVCAALSESCHGISNSDPSALVLSASNE